MKVRQFIAIGRLVVLLFGIIFFVSGCSFFNQKLSDKPNTPNSTACPAVAPCPICPAAILCSKPTPTPQIHPPLRPENSDQLQIIGGVEMVSLVDLGLSFPARIDTGAESSSLHAEDIVLFEREGKRWVRFTLASEDLNEPLVLERRLKRKVLIKQHEGILERRFVVRLRLQLGDINERVDVTLANRSEMNYPLLIGRNYLTDTAIVDVSKKHLTKKRTSVRSTTDKTLQAQ